jgi:signal transduction histidine kinase
MSAPSGLELPTARLRASIRTKLIAMTATVVAIIVGSLAIYFPAREIGDLEQEQFLRASTYGNLLAGQVRSAVAFADRETAREVLSSLTVDPDVVAISLFGEYGDELFHRGTSGSWVEQARDGLWSSRVFRVGDRVAVVVPVESLEGPRGTLVVELSSVRSRSYAATLTRTALVVGLGAVIFGALAAYLIARSFVRRLRAIIDVASSASHDSAQRMVEVDSEDEIGVLGDAFNHMLSRLHADRAHLHQTVADLTAAEEQLAGVNRDLEGRVGARTAALSEANRQLQLEMTRRSGMELELRQSQKLESVGRLASGIAHEINTPVQFVNDSCVFLESASDALLTVIADYRSVLDDLGKHTGDVAVALERSRAIEIEHDLPYLAEHIPLAIQRTLLGLSRVSAIVRGLKEFAYPDRHDQVPSDLNRAIRNTLTVAHNEYKHLAELETDFGELPLVKCHIGELNQVVLNLVVNAAHAIEARHTLVPGKIVVRTASLGEDVTITIEDNGCGMPASVIEKIFDPFFTTKEIGKGTGQGLAIARAVVVDKHHGKLEVASKVGAGTTFTITLPVGGVVAYETAVTPPISGAPTREAGGASN